MLGEGVKVSFSFGITKRLATKLPSCSTNCFLWFTWSLFISWIDKKTYIGPAKMVSINIKHRHDIEIQMIQHFSHGWVTPIGLKSLKRKDDNFLTNWSQVQI